ncbi:MAG: substrate-binding domain-containing protein [Bacteroidetes bacterium]|nr:substrate-binding domain-containing protein [Bacteroidota bacterium]
MKNKPVIPSKEGSKKRGNNFFISSILFFVPCFLSFVSCSDPYFKNDYEDNSPTSGKLKVYYDEGLQLHIENQAYTFQAHYPNASIELVPSNDNNAVQALYNDSCKMIIISRQLTDKEKKAFTSKAMTPQFSAVAKSGIAFITNKNTPIDVLNYNQIVELLTKPFVCKDSLSNDTKLTLLFDKANSSVMQYLLDSVLSGNKISGNCSISNSSIESINYVANHKNTIAIIDFAWLSDVDDSIYKSNKSKVKLIAVSQKGKTNEFEYPSQNSFKLKTYPFTRTVYIYKRGGDFSLGKGFETFIAGPNGQISFLKQGLLPTKQQERSIQVNMNP